MNGELIPGRQHTVIITNHPLKRKYVKHANVYIDENIKDVGKALLDELSSENDLYVSLKRDNVVEGRSWEMAAHSAFNGINDVFSGTVDRDVNGTIIYGMVPGKGIKKMVNYKTKFGMAK